MYLVMRNSNSESVFLEPFESKPITVSGLMAMLIELRYALTLDCTPKKLFNTISISRTTRKRRNGYSISSLSNLPAIQEVCRMRKLLFSVLLFILVSCKFPTAADDPSIVSNLRFTPSAFDSFTKNTEVQYTLKNPVAVNISIVKRDSSGQEYLVKTLAEDIHETKGTHRHTWLGDTRKVYSLRSVHTSISSDRIPAVRNHCSCLSFLI